jgi:hypothetical protein
MVTTDYRELVSPHIRSVFVEARQWLDKNAGQSYFSARVFINGQVALVLPFQNGYESAFREQALIALKRAGLVSEEIRSLWNLREAGVDLYDTIYLMKKADVVRFGKAEVYA